MTYLIKHAQSITTPIGQSIDIRIQHGKIVEIGQELVPNSNEQCVDATGCVAYPGLVNTHHHLAQSVLKGIPEGLNTDLGDWLSAVPYRFWPHISPKLMYLSAKLGLFELQRSGATTCADHHYLYHADTNPDLEEALWQAASDMGMRFTLCRGSATNVGSHRGMQRGLIVPETEKMVLNRLDASLQHHDTSPFAMKKLCVAPTSLIHSSQAEHLKNFAHYARQHDLRLHSHLLEVDHDQHQSLKKYGMSAVEFAANCNWVGEDVWFAHLVKTNAQDRAILAETKTGMSHCPTSNCRLGSGIASALEMATMGMNVSIGVDGSASSESGSMLQETNLAWLLQRAQYGANAITLDTVFDWATVNGAKQLGYQTGKLKAGYAADIVLFRIDTPRLATVHSPQYAPLLCGEPAIVEHNFINGEPVIEHQVSTKVDIDQLISDITQEIKKLMHSIV